MLWKRKATFLSQLFIADETGLWWKCIPSKTLVHCGEKYAKKRKRKRKGRVMLHACDNSTGTCKLPLPFIIQAKSHIALRVLPPMQLLPLFFY